MELKQITKLFTLRLPISKDGIVWNGRPDEFNNIGFGLNYSQQYGYTPYSRLGVYGKYKDTFRGHNGIDIAGVIGTPITAPCRCWVSYTGFDKDGYGNFCFLETDKITVDGENYKLEIVLAHMREFPEIKPGKWVEAMSLIGYMGSTGMSTGSHTHFGTRLLKREKDGSWVYFIPEDGFRGYNDPELLLIDKLVYNKQDLINAKNMLEKNEKKFVVEGNGKGRKFVVVNGKLREIKKDRESAAAIYVMTNNGLGITVDESLIGRMDIGEEF